MSSFDFLPAGFELHNGKYQIVGLPLGYGGFGVTYKGIHQALRGAVAIKEYFPDGLALRQTNGQVVSSRANDENFQEGLKRFMREGNNLEMIHQPKVHPHIVGIRDLFEENGTAYLVMEFIEGSSLRQILKDRPDHKLTLAEAEHLMAQVVEGLAAVHRAKPNPIYHLDLKPDNIMVTEERAVLIDFGAAKQAKQEGAATVLVASVLTPAYAAPEMEGKSEVGPESDIYTLGMIAYEIIVGQRPPSVRERMNNQMLSDWKPGLEAGPWRNMIEAALTWDRAKRPKEAQVWWALHTIETMKTMGIPASSDNLPVLIANQPLFQPEEPRPLYLTKLTLGLVKAYRLNVEPNRFYLVEKGANAAVYDQEQPPKFWHLVSLKPSQVVSLPRRFNLAVEVKDMPGFASESGQPSGWVALSYNLLIELDISLEQVRHIYHAPDPLGVIAVAAQLAVYKALAFTTYYAMFSTTSEEIIEQYLKTDPNVQASNFEIIRTLIIKGDKRNRRPLLELQQPFNQLLQAIRDGHRSELIWKFDLLDKGIQRWLIKIKEAELSQAAWIRATQQVLEALLASGLSLTEIGPTISQAIDGVKPTGSLAREIMALVFHQIKPADWPPLEIPPRLSHEARLKWERQQIQQRAPIQLQKMDQAHYIFTFIFETGDKLEIIWPAPELRPAIYINGQDHRLDYLNLWPQEYDYYHITLWDLYLETRRLLNLERS